MKEVVLYFLPSKLKSSSRENILNKTWGKKTINQRLKFAEKR